MDTLQGQLMRGGEGGQEVQAVAVVDHRGSGNDSSQGQWQWYVTGAVARTGHRGSGNDSSQGQGQWQVTGAVARTDHRGSGGGRLKGQW